MAEVRDQSQAYFDALNSDDPAAATALRFDDVVQMAPNSPPRMGASAIEASFRRFRAANNHRVETTIDDVDASGDLGVVRATFEQTIMPMDGSDGRIVTGSWLLVWRRHDGGPWKMSFETWTTYPIE